MPDLLSQAAFEHALLERRKTEEKVAFSAATRASIDAARQSDDVAVHVVFETHSWSEDNDRGVATGWLPGSLSTRGRALAREIGQRRRSDGVDVVFSSDLRRAVQTAEIALREWTSPPPLLLDWRLRECDYGELNGSPASEVHASVADVDDRFPGGETWREAVERVLRVFDDLRARWDDRRVLVIGHMSAYWALEHAARGMSLEEIGRGFTWKEGWTYEL